MADSMNVTNPKQPVTQTRYIDWRNLTADQIKKYDKEGEDVPKEILKWAKEMDKITNAPDDVTYEMVNGTVNEEEIANITGTKTEKMKTEETAEAEKEKAVKTEEEKNAKANVNEPADKAQDVKGTETVKAASETDKTRSEISEKPQVEGAKNEPLVQGQKQSKETDITAANGASATFGQLLNTAKNKETQNTKEEDKTNIISSETEEKNGVNLKSNNKSVQKAGDTAVINDKQDSAAKTEKEETDTAKTNEQNISTDPEEIQKRKRRRALA